MAADVREAAFPYHEPPIVTILTQAGLLLVLNIVNTCLDRLLYCGLIGQLFVGILWGTPGAKWLDRGMETAIQQLGYIGLTMLVYDGGLSTSIKSLKANLLISLAVAITGISAPIGLSFILTKLLSASSLQAFAAGAALSATSLGTTFTVLSTTQLTATRIGTVTASAAMLDDIVGLVMVQIISNLSRNGSSFNAVTVIRPVFVSIGFAVGLFLLCGLCLKPILRKIFALQDHIPRFMATMQFAFVAHTCVLVGIVAGGTYAGTSNLFAAYLAGLVISWFDGLAAETRVRSIAESDTAQAGSSTPRGQASCVNEGVMHQNPKESSDIMSPSASPTTQKISPHHEVYTGELLYKKYYKEPVSRILIPFFFASIGFAIPITEMFKGSIIWRGMIYAILMIIGKMVTGLWLLRFSMSPVLSLVLKIRRSLSHVGLLCTSLNAGSRRHKEKQRPKGKNCQSTSQPTGNPEHPNDNNSPNKQGKNTEASPYDTTNQSSSQMPSHTGPSQPGATANLPPKPKSLYPLSILGLAMVARGEIGYLIASLAESQGIFSSGLSEGPSEIYLVVVWAISICTLVGPISVGMLVKRVKRLEQKRENSGGSDPLGAWGI